MTQVTLRGDSDTLTALLEGEIDHHWAAIVREQIDARVRAAAPKTLVLDFSGVTFMDSSGVGLVLGRHRLAASLGGTVVVRHAPPGVRRTLALAGIESKD